MPAEAVVMQVRAKYMTLEPGANRYVKYIRNIRDIQVPTLVLRSELYVWDLAAHWPQPWMLEATACFVSWLLLEAHQ